jgi:hypothetical protein
MAIYSEFSHLKMVIFHSYVSLPDGSLVLKMTKRPSLCYPPQILNSQRGRFAVFTVLESWALLVNVGGSFGARFEDGSQISRRPCGLPSSNCKFCLALSIKTSRSCRHGFCALTQSHTAFQNHYGGMRQYTRPQWPTQVLNLYSSGCPTWR